MTAWLQVQDRVAELERRLRMERELSDVLCDELAITRRQRDGWKADCETAERLAVQLERQVGEQRAHLRVSSSFLDSIVAVTATGRLGRRARTLRQASTLARDALRALRRTTVLGRGRLP